MNRITQTFAELKKTNKKALVTYIVCGDPYPEATLDTMHALVDAGADVIELGVPFSDPMAEGPVIQRGHERALAKGMSLRATLATVEAFRQTNTETPVILMGYANPVERMGYETFAEAATAVGVDGLLTVDLPPEEAKDPNAILKAANVESIFLLSPTTTDVRAEAITAMAGGFLYYVSLKGVTGAGHLDVEAVEQRLTYLRTLSDLPLCVGFGIKDAESAKTLANLADGVVIGSRLVDTMAQFTPNGESGASDTAHTTQAIGEALKAVLVPIRRALDEITPSP